MRWRSPSIAPAGVSVMRTGSLIGFMRGRTLSSAATNFEAARGSTLPPLTTVDTGAPLTGGRDRTSSFIVNISAPKASSRRASMVTKSRNNSSLVNSRFRGSTSQTPHDIDSIDGKYDDTPNLPRTMNFAMEQARARENAPTRFRTKLGQSTPNRQKKKVTARVDYRILCLPLQRRSR